MCQGGGPAMRSQQCIPSPHGKSCPGDQLPTEGCRGSVGVLTCLHPAVRKGARPCPCPLRVWLCQGGSSSAQAVVRVRPALGGEDWQEKGVRAGALIKRARGPRRVCRVVEPHLSTTEILALANDAGCDGAGCSGMRHVAWVAVSREPPGLRTHVACLLSGLLPVFSLTRGFATHPGQCIPKQPGSWEAP